MQPLPLPLSDEGPPQQRSLHTSMVVSVFSFCRMNPWGVAIKMCSLNDLSCLLPLGTVSNRAYVTPWTLTTMLESSKNVTTETELRAHKEQIKPLLGQELWLSTSKPHFPGGPPVPSGP